MKRTLFLYLLSIIILPLSLPAQSYLWPTNASEFMSSSFCEFREGHYHSAIDIKTWNTEGYACYAIEDGYIKRIRVSPFGYGKVLYLQLNDGRTAVYAHLQKFTKEIDRQIRKMQFSDQKYRVNWQPKNLKVKKGDIIAYTGRTGIGVPHLHFEIRDKNDNPLNPLQFYSQVKDHRRPKLQNLAVIPLAEDALINGKFLPRIFNLTHIKDGVYVIKEPITVKGRVGLAIKGYDQADQVYNKYGFYSSILEAGGRPLFRLAYDKLEFATSGHIDTEIVYRYWAEKRQVFHKLFLETFNPLPFYDRLLDADGTLIVTDKPVSFNITISDFHQNQSVVSGELLPLVYQQIEVSELRKHDNWLYLSLVSPIIKDLSLAAAENEADWQAIAYFEIVNSTVHNPRQNLQLKIKLPSARMNKIRVKINNSLTRTIYIVDQPLLFPISPIKCAKDFLDNRLVLSLNVQNAMKFFGMLADIPKQIIDEDLIQFVLPARDIAKKTAINKNAYNALDSCLNFSRLRIISPYHDMETSWFDSKLVLETRKRSVNDTTIIFADTVSSATLSGQYEVQGPVYQIMPDNFPLFRSFFIHIQADSLPSWGKWALYRTNRENNISYIRTKQDTVRMILSGRSSSAGGFVIASDTIAPEINILSPLHGKTYPSSPPIKVVLNDQVSGIGDEENISLAMNGAFVLPEWDPEEKVLVGILERPLTTGKHVFSVSVRDRMGNITREAIYFQIK